MVTDPVSIERQQQTTIYMSAGPGCFLFEKDLIFGSILDYARRSKDQWVSNCSPVKTRNTSLIHQVLDEVKLKHALSSGCRLRALNKLPHEMI